MKLSFVIIEYFSINDVCSCVLSIMNNIKSYDYEIIISSNSLYTVDKQRDVLGRCAKCKWIFNIRNGGFAYGMNCGLKEANGDILVMLNPDVKIKSGFEDMVRYFCKHSDIGIIAPQIINLNGVRQDSFRDFITPCNFLLRHLDRICFKKNSVCELKYPVVVDWVIGAFMMTSNTAYKKIGKMDEKYFLYCEDMDLCKRMNMRGYKNVYFPNAIVEYEGSRSARYSLKYAFVFFKSLFYYWKKYRH